MGGPRWLYPSTPALLPYPTWAISLPSTEHQQADSTTHHLGHTVVHLSFLQPFLSARSLGSPSYLPLNAS